MAVTFNGDVSAVGGAPSDAKSDNKPSTSNTRRGKHNYRNGVGVIHEKFNGAHPDLTEFIFTHTSTNDPQHQRKNAKAMKGITEFIGRTCNEYTTESIEKGKLTFPDKPIAVEDPVTKVMTKADELVYRDELTRYNNVKSKVTTETKQCFHLYHGQCSPTLIASLKENAEYEQVYQEKNVFKLCSMIKSITYKSGKKEEPFLGLINGLRLLCGLTQGPQQSTDSYYDTFASNSEQFDDTYGPIMSVVRIICEERDVKPSDLNATEMADALKEGRDRFTAMLFFLNSDPGRFGPLVENYAQDFIGGIDKYPTSLSEAYRILNQTPTKPNRGQRPPHGTIGLSFNTNGDDGDRTPSRNKYPPCQKCGRTNHLVENCYATRRSNGELLHTMGYSAPEEIEDDDIDCGAADVVF